MMQDTANPAHSFGATNQTGDVRQLVHEVVQSTPVVDIHTHLFAPEFDALNLSGIDELLTYHYLAAETVRATAIAPDQFWALTKTEQADLVWKTLFVERTPISEAARGVISVLSAFGLDANTRDLREARAFFSARNAADHISDVLRIAGVTDVVMTNDPFSQQESALWQSVAAIDRRYHAVVRLDRMFTDWSGATERIAAQTGRASAGSVSSKDVRKFLDHWIEVMKPLYMAVSLTNEFNYPGDENDQRVLDEVVLPLARDHKLPLALMIGVRRLINPALKFAGDGVGKADLTSLQRLCLENSDLRFFSTVLARENQHELCVIARKFANLMPFGCWWFLNNPSIVSEITRQRLELLGTSFIPQHSDARVLEQLIYKWKHSRQVIADALATSYENLEQSGRLVTRADIQHDVTRLFSGNFRGWVELDIDARSSAHTGAQPLDVVSP